MTFLQFCVFAICAVMVLAPIAIFIMLRWGNDLDPHRRRARKNTPWLLPNDDDSA